MSLNSIRFEPADIALLFKNSLVEIETTTPVLPKPSIDTDPVNNTWKYLGVNKKNSLVCVRYPGVTHLPDKQLSFLTKLLSACSLSLDDVAIFNFEKYSSADFDKIMDYFKPRFVLLFNIKPSEFGMPMNFPEFQVQAYKDAVFVSSPPLEIIEPDKTAKGKLWICLKRIFNL